MEIELKNTHQNDPLGSTFLLPRTLEGFSAEQGMEFEPIHDSLSCRALNDPGKLLEQASAILNAISEGKESELAQQLPPKNVDRKGTANDVENPQRRRPALGRKRAQFSFKPSQSEFVSHVDISMDIDSLQDPDEFFAAHERRENAERELKKSRGDTSDDLIQHHNMAIRHRRPGILGKTVSYKHLYPTTGGKENYVSSQEEKSIVEGPRSFAGTLDMLHSNISHPESGQTAESQGKKTSEYGHLADPQEKGSMAETENRVTTLLDELLSMCKELDEGEVVSVLQERLQVMPITLDKISLPDLGSVQRTDLKAPLETISRPRKPLSDLQQGTKSTINAKTPTKSRQKTESFRCSSTSPTPSRSPFASMSILRKRILQEDSMKNTFYMSFNPDVSSTEQPGSIQSMGKQALSPPRTTWPGTGSLDVGGDSISSKIDEESSSLDARLKSSVTAEGNIVGGDVSLGKSQMVDFAHSCYRFTNDSANTSEHDINIISIAKDNIAGHDLNSGKFPTVDSACPSDRPTDETMNKFDSGINITSAGKSFVGSDVNAGQQPLLDLASPSRRPTDETMNRIEHDVNIPSNGLDNSSQDKAKDTLVEAPVSPEKEECQKGLATETLHCIGNQPGADRQIVGQQSENADVSKEHPTEEQQAPCTTSVNEQTEKRVPQQKQSEKEAPPHKRSKRESRSLRQSLAGAGTKVESGVRRSTRIKSRPLEYWRGERFLYGRIHDSLPTIIGMKYSSPGKSDKGPVLKVKSYVSEEYAELVEMAALH